MESMGLLPRHFEAEPPVEVWPDVWPAMLLFDSLGTQWRCGPGGFYGLDKNILYRKLDRLGLSPEAYERLETDIDVMEAAALAEMHKDDKQ